MTFFVKTFEINEYIKILERNRVASPPQLVEGMREMYKGGKIMVETFEVLDGEVHQTKKEIGDDFDIELKTTKRNEHPVLSYSVDGEPKYRHMLSQEFVYEKNTEDQSRESLVVCWKSEKTGKEMIRRFSLAS